MLRSIPFYSSLLGKQINEKTNATHSHVLLYGAIEVHSFGKRGCVASNATIAQETGLTESTVSKTLSQLVSCGWVRVTWKGEKFGRRDQIIPLLEIAPLLHSKTTLTDQKGYPYSPVKIDNSKDNSIDINVFNVGVSEVKSLTGTQEQLLKVKSVFELFDRRGLSMNMLWKTPSQRNSAVLLYDNKGLEKIGKALDFYLENKSVDYCPYVSTPYDLANKWDKLLTFKNK